MLRDIILVYLLGLYLDGVVKAQRQVFLDSPDGGVELPVILPGEVIMPVGNQSSDTALPGGVEIPVILPGEVVMPVGNQSSDPALPSGVEIPVILPGEVVMPVGNQSSDTALPGGVEIPVILPGAVIKPVGNQSSDTALPGGVEIPVVLPGKVIIPVGNQSSDTALPDATMTPIVTQTPELPVVVIMPVGNQSSHTALPDATRTPSVTQTPDATRTASITQTPDATRTPSVTQTPDATRTPSVTQTPDATRTSSVTQTPDATRTPSVALTPDDTNAPDAIKSPGTTLSPVDPIETRKTDTTTSSLALTGPGRHAVDPIEPRPTDNTPNLTLTVRPVANDRPQTTAMENTGEMGTGIWNTKYEPGETSIQLADVCLWYFNDSYTGNANIFRTYLNVTSEACESYISGCSGICAGDSQCIIYNDCCIDAIDQYVDTNAAIHNDFSSFRNTSLLYAQLAKNEYIYQAHIHIRTHTGCVGNKYNSMSYWMINKCPTNSNTSTVIIQKCENETQFSVSRVPVYYIDRNGVAFTFQNIFCAICHGVNTEMLYTWTVHYKCGENIIVDAATELKTIEDECRIQYTYPTGDYRQHLRPCSKYESNLVSVPEATEDNIEQYPDEITEPSDVYLNSLKYLCRVYIYPVDINGTIYRNPHCAAYATIWHQKNHTMFFKISSEICSKAFHKEEGPGNIENGTPDLKSLFDFDPEHGYTVRRTCEQTCKIHQIADCALDACRDLYCPANTVPQYGYCVLANTAGTEPVSYTFHLPFDDSIKTADSVIYVIQYSSAAEDVTVENLESYITDVFTIMEYVGSVETVDVNAFISEGLNNVHIVDYSVYVTIVYRHEKHPLELAFNSGYQELLRHLQLDNMTLLSIYMKNFISVSRLSCLQGIKEAENYQVFSMENVAVLFNFTGTFIPAEDTRWLKTLLDEGDAAMTRHIVDLAISCFVEDTNDDMPSGLNCSMIAYDRDEFTIVDNVLHVINSSLRYNTDEFIEYDGKAFVCDNKIREMNEQVFMFFTYSKSHKIITVVTSAISMVALVAIIAVHLLVSKLRNGHGLNITALSVTMFLMQAVMLIDIKRGGPICTIFGICLHFLLLKMFVWMNIIGFDMTRIFYTKFATAHGNVMNRFIKYLSFAFGIPLVVVLICFGLDYSDVSIRPKYGDGDVCYITNSIAVAAFVIGPVTFSILVNFTMFSVSVYSIQKAKRATKHVRNSSDRAYCLVYFKMTVILGFTWILAIVAALVKVEAIWYVHTVLNGLQGVSIFVCFVLNARVLKAVSEKSKLYTESSTFTSRVSCTESKVCNSLKDGNTTELTTTSSNGV